MSAEPTTIAETTLACGYRLAVVLGDAPSTGGDRPVKFRLTTPSGEVVHLMGPATATAILGIANHGENHV